MEIDAGQERLFNVRKAVPEHPQVFRNWRRWSDEFKDACTKKCLDLAYGEGEAQTLDIFYPSMHGPGPYPAAMLIHGGYWQAMDKADVAFAARGLTENGFAIAAVNHTLCPAVGLSDIVEEVRCASLWLWCNAAGMNIERDRLAVVGHSAGGHLAAMMMCTDWPARALGAPSCVFGSCLAISGLFDLAPLVHTTINEKVGLTPETAADLSPVRHRPTSSVPILAWVGGDESDGFHDQAVRLHNAWQATGVNVDVKSAPGCNHFQVFELLADCRSSMCVAVSDGL